MQIEANQTYALLMSAQSSRAASNSVNNDDETTQQATTATATTDKAAKKSDNAATGGMTSKIASETNRALIDQQETSTSNTGADDYDGPLSLADRHGIEDIINNPEYAATRSREIGVYGELAWVGKVLPTENNGFSAADRKAFLARQDRNMAAVQQVQEQRTAYYESLTEQGLSPVEIYAKLLEFNANLPESHDKALGWSASGRANGMSYSDYHQAKLDYLQSLTGQGGSIHMASSDISGPGEE